MRGSWGHNTVFLGAFFGSYSNQVASFSLIGIQGSTKDALKTAEETPKTLQEGSPGGKIGDFLWISQRI